MIFNEFFVLFRCNFARTKFHYQNCVQPQPTARKSRLFKKMT